jgi:hypothetical protein
LFLLAKVLPFLARFVGFFPVPSDGAHELPPSISQELDFLLEQPTLQLDPRQMNVRLGRKECPFAWVADPNSYLSVIRWTSSQMQWS